MKRITPAQIKLIKATFKALGLEDALRPSLTIKQDKELSDKETVTVKINEEALGHSSVRTGYLVAVETKHFIRIEVTIYVCGGRMNRFDFTKIGHCDFDKTNKIEKTHIN
jgi:hypothetical protein